MNVRTSTVRQAELHLVGGVADGMLAPARRQAIPGLASEALRGFREETRSAGNGGTETEGGRGMEKESATVAFVIYGEPASKANSRKIVTFGKRPASIKSEKARNFEEDALRQIPPAARLQLTGRIRAVFRIFYASERPDLDESIVLDVLQDRFKTLKVSKERVLVQRGVYRNDRQVREKHVFHGIDRKNPRVEVEITALEPQQVGIAL